MVREPAGWPGLVLAAIFFALIFHARPVAGYSILAHQGLVDTLWTDEIVPLLRDRFPGLTAADLARARAYAYGGSLIQDLGYYPFGSHLFTNLTHYARTGDFVQSLIRNATIADEYAFALGALAHYSADIAGHPMAVNRAVPLMYPKVRAETGERALYVDSPVRHVMVEFGYDVLAVARGAYVAQAYRDRIGFEVSKGLLERAIRETYALELGDLLLSVDLAIGTYRRAVSKTIPELTRIAWRDRRQEIEQRTPGITEQAFIFSLSPSDYDREFGTKYRRPGILARILAVILSIVPKVGPLRPLAFEPLTAEVERLFLESEIAARTRYRALLQELRSGRLVLPDADFDTGGPAAFGQNRLADETNADLLHKLARRRFAGVSSELRRHFNGFFASISPSREGASRKEVSRIRSELALMNLGGL